MARKEIIFNRQNRFFFYYNKSFFNLIFSSQTYIYMYMFQYSNKIIIKEYIFPTFLYIFDPVCIIYQHFRTWKWGLDTHFANCLKSGTMILLNSAGSITSRISSSSFRNITCNTHLSKYDVKLLTEFSKISGFPLNNINFWFNLL